jgi:HK97 family phage prohead protease
MNKRNFVIRNTQIRAETKNDSRWVEGIIPYNSKSYPIWGTTEIIDEGAFRKTLTDKANVKALYNHDDSRVLGTTKNETLILEDSEEGLICKCKLPNTSYANDLYEIVTRGDVRTMSFGFIPVKWEDTENGKFRTLKEVKLDEVSYCVSYPAYPETNSKTYMRGFMKRKIDIEIINEILEKEELTEEDITVLQETVNIITKIISDNTPDSKEAVREEPPKNDTPPKTDTSPDKEKEEIKAEIQELIDSINLYFEIDKETNKEKTNE